MVDADAQIEDAAVTSSSNAYCAALGIHVPRVEDALSSADANYYSLLLVALLERGAPMTLDEVAARFEDAGVASTCDALASLKRCKPARAPIYRDGNHYSLDPYDDEVGFWLSRLGLRSPRFAPLQAVRPAPGPLPSPDVPLTIASLEEAWRQGIPMTWSAQRVALNVDPGERRLAELGPPRKTRQLNRRGRTLAITTSLLVQGSCGIRRPFGNLRTLREYLDAGEHAKFRRGLGADAKSLSALYQYSRLHGAVRLRWGYLDEMLPAPRVHRDEPTLYSLLREAQARDVPLEVVVGSAPGWADPWSRVQRACVATDAWGSPSLLVDEQGGEIPRAEVQLARLADVAGNRQ